LKGEGNHKKRKMFFQAEPKGPWSDLLGKKRHQLFERNLGFLFLQAKRRGGGGEKKKGSR